MRFEVDENLLASVPRPTNSKRRGVTWSQVCELALRLPGVERGTSYGTPSLHVRKKFLARLKEDGETVAIRVDFADRDVLIELDPAAFYVTDHYVGHPAMLVRLKQVRFAMLERLIEQAWHMQAPKSLVRNAAGAPTKGKRVKR